MSKFYAQKIFHNSEYEMNEIQFSKISREILVQTIVRPNASDWVFDFATIRNTYKINMHQRLKSNIYELFVIWK